MQIRRTAPGRDCCSSASMSSAPTDYGQGAPIHCMLTWWEHAISRCERFSSGKTGKERGTCQLPLMDRTMRTKLHASPGMQNCGGVQIQAPHGVTDMRCGRRTLFLLLIRLVRVNPARGKGRETSWH